MSGMKILSCQEKEEQCVELYQTPKCLQYYTDKQIDAYAQKFRAFEASRGVVEGWKYSESVDKQSFRGHFAKPGSKCNTKNLKDSAPAPTTFPRCKLYRASNVCDIYELSITGRNIISC